ncbi:MAG: hypothetical protein HUU25_02900 [Candidatus Sumerlaeia bacterium]|nr:hypothetical protein [Candidatus Sumerlaeia bacterium]
MANLARVLLLTENEKLRNFLLPLSQWLELHAPLKAIDALEHIGAHQPQLILIDATVLTPMVMALLTTIRQLPQYSGVPLVILGETPQAKRLQPDAQFGNQFNLRRLEEKIADLAGVKLTGRAMHGPHSGSIY